MRNITLKGRLQIMIAQLISCLISIILFIWMLRIKKEHPLPKGSVAKMVVSGALCCIISTILVLSIAILVALIRIGFDDLYVILSDPTSEQTMDIITQIQSMQGQYSLRSAFASAFVTAAIVEEGLKYLAMRFCSHKAGTINTRMDAIVCGAIIGLTFQIIEDFNYASDVFIALTRAIMPFHFVFGAIMGYYYGKFLVTGYKIDKAKALIIPILVHGLFDFSIDSTKVRPEYFLLTLVVMVFMWGLTIYLIIKIRKWNRDESFWNENFMKIL